jgi:two-component system KDP operon response regulator KdpE
MGATPLLADVAVLIVGRRSARLSALASWLADEGCVTRNAADVGEALVPSKPYRPALVILDVGDTAPWVITGLRKWTDLPVIAVHAGRGAALDAALAAGADDYLTVPLSRTEVSARLRAVVRRRRTLRADQAGSPETRVVTEHFELDVNTHQALAVGRTVRLTATEWRIVEVLVRRPGVLVTHADLVIMVWGPGRFQTHGLRVHLSSIRRKLEPEPGRPRYFVTEIGTGLPFEPHGEALVGDSLPLGGNRRRPGIKQERPLRGDNV